MGASTFRAAQSLVAALRILALPSLLGSAKRILLAASYKPVAGAVLRRVVVTWYALPTVVFPA